MNPVQSNNASYEEIGLGYSRRVKSRSRCADALYGVRARAAAACSHADRAGSTRCGGLALQSQAPGMISR
jgi:hypothetical protein